ncbi:MAG: hypothetical protein RLZZ558_1810 [Planctomycetota bacterium]|jgi:hypothetical protein
MALILLAGCVSSTEPAGPPKVLMPRSSGSVLIRSPDGAVIRDTSLRLSLEALGSVRTDGFRLPLVSPAGDRIAWQARSNADWSMLVGNPGNVALNASVAARPLPEGSGWELGDRLLLGRQADDRGVLVESIREDGSRWIGRATWDGSEPTWMIQDARVNAFGTLGPRGEMGWCHRSLDETCLGLSVQRPEGRIDFPRREGESWLMPVVAAEGIYACSLRDGILELAFLPIRPGEHLTTSQAEPAMLRQRLSIRATPRTAWQVLEGVPADRAAGPAGLVFFHPQLRRMAIWNPRADRVTLLAEGSVSAWMDGEATALVSLPDQLVMQEVPPEPGMAPLKLIPGLWTCRGRDRQGFILAGPSGDGMTVSRLRLGDPSPE